MSSTTPPEPWTLPELTRARRAIVVVDVVESVRLMQEDEAGFIERWRRFVHQVRTEVLPTHGGRMVKSLGDGMLLEFERVQPAVIAALSLRTLGSIPMRMGIHLADVLADELDVYGHGVNLAARLATLGRPGDITASVEVHDALSPGLDADLDDLGECFVKHLDEPVRAFRVSSPESATGEVIPPDAVAGTVRPAIAVLPFDAIAGRAEICADLWADAVHAGLSRSDSFDVISRLSCSRLRGRADALQCARSVLRADFVLSGRVVYAGASYSVITELAETRREFVIWTHSGQEAMSDLLAARSDLALEVVEGAKNAVLEHTLRRIHGSALPSLDTYALLLGGITHLHRMGRRDFELARELLQAAADRAPRHPSPQAWLAKWHVLQAQQGWVNDPARTAAQASDCARRALEADAEDSLALTMDALVHVHFRRRLDEADALYRRAVEANPNDALAWLHKGMLHAFRGEGEDGVRDTERAIALSPLDPMKYYFDTLGASAAATAGHYARAVELAERSLRANCLHTSSLRVLAISQVMLGRGEEARAAVARLLALEIGRAHV